MIEFLRVEKTKLEAKYQKEIRKKMQEIDELNTKIKEL